jgi:hypothetical protein
VISWKHFDGGTEGGIECSRDIHEMLGQSVRQSLCAPPQRPDLLDIVKGHCNVGNQ